MGNNNTYRRLISNSKGIRIIKIKKLSGFVNKSLKPHKKTY